MDTVPFVEELAKTYGISTEAFLREGAELALRARKKAYLRERLEILARYGVGNARNARRARNARTVYRLMVL